MYFQTLTQMKKMLLQLDKWLEASAAHAHSKSFDQNLFLGFRLAPDQFAFAKQVQVACDTAKLMASRLTGKEAQKNADDEQSLEALRARVHSTVAYLETFTANDFDAAAARVISQPRWEGKTMSGADFFMEHAVPNFFFHITHVYAILRHNGVDVGKKDYLGKMPYKK